MAEMVFCHGCGKEIHESAVACPHCGATQSSATCATTSFARTSVSNIPDGVKGWSWGAFWLSWIWAIGNRTWIGLLSIIPFVGFIMWFVLGIKGREWAWKNKKWDSVEHFNRVQKIWSILGWILVPGCIAVAVAIPAYHNYNKKKLDAEGKVSADALAAKDATSSPLTPIAMPTTAPPQQVKSEWVKLATTTALVFYVDPSSRIRKGDNVILLDLTDEINPKSESKSAIGENEFDCKEKKYRRLTVTDYSERMGQGEVIYLNDKAGEWNAISPKSLDESYWKIACDVK